MPMLNLLFGVTARQYSHLLPFCCLLVSYRPLAPAAWVAEAAELQEAFQAGAGTPAVSWLGRDQCDAIASIYVRHKSQQ